jgi:hypothetical protein
MERHEPEGSMDVNGQKAEHRERWFSVERVIASGSLAISVVILTQLLQVEPPLTSSLTISLYCCAVSIPLSSLDLVLMSARLDRKADAGELSTRHYFLYVWGFNVWGPLVALVGTIAVFAHFSGISAILFAIISVAAFVCGMVYLFRYYPT